MIKRYSEYETYNRHARKLFSPSQKITIACHQKYMCVGKGCNSKTLLPISWEADHKTPLFKGGSNFYDYDNPHNPESNIQIICPTCHGNKTVREKQEFYAIERVHKFNTYCHFEQADSFYKKPVKMRNTQEFLNKFVYKPS